MTTSAPSVDLRVDVPVGSTELTVHAVTDEPGFDALEVAWSRVYQAGGGSAFQSFGWQRAWWRHYGEGDPTKRLHLLVVSRTDTGEVVAIAPFFTERLRALGVLPVTRMAMIGQERSDYLDLLLAEGWATDSLKALAEYLSQHRSSFDVLVMEELPDHSPTLAAWREALAAHGLASTRTACDQCPRIRFADTWEATEAALPPATRGKMRRRVKHLRNRHGAQLELAGRPGDLDRDLDELIELHQQRWTASGLPGVFAEPAFVGFFREAAHALALQDELVVAFLRVDGRRVAGICGFRHRDEFHFYMGGLAGAGDAARYSPGIALHLLYMQESFDQGVRTYDLLRGVEPYKVELGAVPVATWRVSVPGRTRGLGRWPYLVTQLQARVQRRIAHERGLLTQLRSEPGTGPGDVRRHLADRLRANLAESTARVRRTR